MEYYDTKLRFDGSFMIPFIPIIQSGEQPFSMFRNLKRKYDWFLDILVYDTPSNLIKGLEKAVVKPALELRDVLLSKKVEQLRMRHIGDYVKPLLSKTICSATKPSLVFGNLNWYYLPHL